MIQYANRGAKAYIALLVCMHGSVVPSSLPPAILSTAISLALAFSYNDGAVVVPDLEYANKAFAIQIYGIVLGFLIVTRTNMAINRYTSAMQGLQVMISKWLDAYMQLCAFVNAHLEDGEYKDELISWREKMAHWFSLMATFAVAALRGDENTIEFHEDPTISQAARLSSSIGGLKSLNTAAAWKLEPGKASHPVSPLGASSVVTDFLFQTVSILGRSDNTSWPRDDAYIGDPSLRSRLEYLGACSSNERKTLSEVHDKVLVVSGWICESITRAVLRNRPHAPLGPVLKVPPPIVSRVYQELSNGMQAYHHALMVVIVPFPFPFAQMLTYLLLGFTILAPFMVLQFTRSVIFSPILTFLGVFGYYGTDMIAKEIENPFGDDVNDLPLLSMHKDFNTSLKELLMPHPHLAEPGSDSPTPQPWESPRPDPSPRESPRPDSSADEVPAAEGSVALPASSPSREHPGPHPSTPGLDPVEETPRTEDSELSPAAKLWKDSFAI
mmetsp:Transcript_90653/g.210861  ORF Transcript_90653/g.210861 Transcript_90653/m.210861 type:complete len:498 (-) Transcript_90653:116-1609(-)